MDIIIKANAYMKMFTKNGRRLSILDSHPAITPKGIVMARLRDVMRPLILARSEGSINIAVKDSLRGITRLTAHASRNM